MAYQYTRTQVKTKSKVAYTYLGYAVLGFLAGAFASLNSNISTANNLCPLFGENECVKTDGCQAIYFQDKSFKECVTLSLEQISIIAQSRELCRSTRGKWQKLNVGQYCACGRGKVFTNNQGCK